MVIVRRTFSIRVLFVFRLRKAALLGNDTWDQISLLFAQLYFKKSLLLFHPQSVQQLDDDNVSRIWYLVDRKV